MLLSIVHVLKEGKYIPEKYDLFFFLQIENYHMRAYGKAMVSPCTITFFWDGGGGGGGGGGGKYPPPPHPPGEYIFNGSCRSRKLAGGGFQDIFFVLLRF